MDEKTAYSQYSDMVRQVASASGNIPHCDSNILHRPETCTYCALDTYKDLHESRVILGINYTGEYKAHLLICPAEQKRNLPQIEKWGGNRATGKES